MAPYNTPQAIRPLEKTICDFRLFERLRSDIRFQRFPALCHSRVLSRRTAPYGLEIQTAAEQAFYGDAYRMDTAHAAGIAIRRMV